MCLRLLFTMKASRLKLNRDKGFNRWRKWSLEDDESLKLLYQQGMDDTEIADKLERRVASVKKRLKELGLLESEHKEKRKTQVSWEYSSLIPFHESSSRGGYRE
jgi:hypothetical protein